MTQEEILKLSKSWTSGNNCFRPDAYHFMKATYHQVPENTPAHGHKWYYGYCDGCDCKYGRLSFCPELMQYRTLNFDEFYGGGVVD